MISYAENFVNRAKFGYIMLNYKREGSQIFRLPYALLMDYNFVNRPLQADFSCYFFELFWSEFQLFAVKIYIIFILDRDQMDVCMGHFEP